MIVCHSGGKWFKPVCHVIGPGIGYWKGTPYDGLYGDGLPERGTFFDFMYMKA